MIKNLTRGLIAVALTLPALAAPATASTPLAAPPAPGAAAVLLLADAVKGIPLAAEVRTGYERTKFKHWNNGLNATDGCNTRAEVLLDEALDAPTVETGCKLTGGRWNSYYDGQTITDPGKLDIDHMVPLAEAWDSGASAWTAARREAYANDQGASTSLVAVSARSNRSKADQDPATWVPPLPEAHCRYIGEWVSTKLRWGLTTDQGEADALGVYAETCEATVVRYTPAP
ncbi:HNH endonuclease family protein [Streptomyces sp. NPDC059247]|uniref:HNH endonuclease family protein n=1 Tax=Streptomyces sp. NPDC059247 TaxID=3346790 RepID=UPI00368728B8